MSSLIFYEKEFKLYCASVAICNLRVRFCYFCTKRSCGCSWNCLLLKKLLQDPAEILFYVMFLSEACYSNWGQFELSLYLLRPGLGLSNTNWIHLYICGNVLIRPKNVVIPELSQTLLNISDYDNSTVTEVSPWSCEKTSLIYPIYLK